MKADPIAVRSELLPLKPAIRLGTGLREPSVVEPTRIATTPPTSSTTISNLVITTTTSGNTLPALQSWLAGDHGPRSGTIKYMTPSLGETICTTHLTGLTITKITVDSATARARAEMTVGGLRLTCP